MIVPTLLIFARYFATTEHVTKRDHTHGGLPYTHHLEAVERVLRRHQIHDPEFLAAAWLHDVVEDCPEVKVKHIAELFGERVAELVEAVTDEPGPNRKARKALTLEKTRAVYDGVILKLADRIANVESGGPLVEMYRREMPTFEHGLQGSKTSVWCELARDEMWDELRQLLAS